MFRLRHAVRVLTVATLLGFATLSLAPAVQPASAQTSQGAKLTARPLAPAAAQQTEFTPGEHDLPGVSFAHLYIPRTLKPSAPAPLALLLHGSGDRGITMINAFSALAEKHGVVLLAVDSRNYTWDIMAKGADLKNTTRVPNWGEDVARIDQALARTFELLPVDAKRLALIGCSDGAGYGLSLGANNADLFDTVIAFSPGLLMRVDNPARGRVFIAHGENDRTLPVEPTRKVFVPVLQDLGFRVTLRLFRGRHEMPAAIRAEAFAWWLRPHAPADAASSAR